MYGGSEKIIGAAVTTARNSSPVRASYNLTMASQSTPSQLNPGRIHQALTSYQLAMALKGAIELELFTYIAAGATTAAAIAPLCQANEKGVRVLCDYLTVHGFLTKSNASYGLAPDTAALLDKNSPAYMGSVADFFTHPTMMNKYRDVAALVRNGGATDHTLAPNDNIWVEFARYMAPMFALPASIAAPHLTTPGQPARVLDIAAGHGLFGIHVALHNHAAEITFQDWDNVLDVARANAAEMGITGRFRTVPGNAFEVDFGTGYDVALLPNFLHHFNSATNVTLLKKVRAALKPAGRVAVIEFVPNEDRVSPPDGALSAMRMLGTTPSGDAYTFAEISRMLDDAGFGTTESRSLAPAHQQLILTRKN
ncbi:MAG: Methyltransferase type 12 [Bryobacterales bacterium]|nr:Methyltransferase type 12 [Bryobacterales bacterium]